MKEGIDDFRDMFGLITQNDFDGGDTSNREGIFYTLLALHKTRTFDDKGRLKSKGFERDLARLTTPEGTFVRHPDQTKWYSNPKCFSRDQHAALLLASASLKRKDLLWKVAKPIFKRFGFHQNTEEMGVGSKKVFPDIITPGEISVFFRGMFGKWAYPFLVIIDSILLLDNIFRKQNLWDADNLIAARLMFELNNTPTFITKLNAKIYRRSDYKERIKFYYSLEKNGIPPLGEYYLFLCKYIID